MKLPKHAAVFPLLLIHAQDTKHAGAARLHVLAACLDHEQNAQDNPSATHGKIARDTLEAAAVKLGVKRSTFYNWLADARAAGILNGKGEYLYLASQAKLAQIFLCNTIDKAKAIIPLKLLFKPGWKDVVFAAYLKVNHYKLVGYDNKLQPVYKPQVIAAKTLEDITGIKERTQRRLKKHIKTRRNIAVTTQRGSYEQAAGMNEAARQRGEKRHYFVFNDTRQKDPAGVKGYRRVIAHTMPARREVSDQTAQIGPRGRRAAILSGLRLVTVCNYSNGYYPARPPQATNSEAERTYARRYFDRYHNPGKPSRGEDAPVTFHERNRRAVIGVWDRVDA